MKETDYIYQLTQEQEVEKIWDMHVRKMREFGFEYLMYGFTSFHVGNHEDANLLSNHDPSYIEGYVKRGIYGNAPMLRWAWHNQGCCSWNIISQWRNDGLLGERELEVIEFNKSYGITAGYTISFRSNTERSKGAIALSATPGTEQAELDEMWKEHGEIIELYNNITHLKLLTLPFQTEHARKLTDRQREALQWVGDGKTTQDIAILMGLKKATIEKHLRLARECLNVETTAQAVLKASLQNQIYRIDQYARSLADL